MAAPALGMQPEAGRMGCPQPALSPTSHPARLPPSTATWDRVHSGHPAHFFLLDGYLPGIPGLDMAMGGT